MAGIYRYPWTFLHLNASPKGVHIEGYSLNTELRSIKRGTGTWKFPRRKNNADTATGEAILQSKVRWVLSWSGIVLIAWYAAFYAFLPLHRFSTSYTSQIFVLSTPSWSVFISLLCFVTLWSNACRASYIYILRKRNIFTCHTTVYWHLGVYTLRTQVNGKDSLVCCARNSLENVTRWFSGTRSLRKKNWSTRIAVAVATDTLINLRTFKGLKAWR